MINFGSQILDDEIFVCILDMTDLFLPLFVLLLTLGKDPLAVQIEEEGQRANDPWSNRDSFQIHPRSADNPNPRIEDHGINSPHHHQRFMYWWIPISAVQRFRNSETIVAKPFLVVYHPVDDGVYPSGNLDVTWRANLNMIGNEVRIVFQDQEIYRATIDSELQQTSVILEPGTHIISIQLNDRSCMLQSREECEIIELSVIFSVARASFAWQEHDQPMVVTGQGTVNAEKYTCTWYNAQTHQ